MKNQKVIYYKDELNDEFSDKKIKARIIDENYRYKYKNPLWSACSWFIQNIFSMPAKVLYSKIKFKIKYVGKEKLKECRNTGYFMYGNHTQILCDTFIPSIPIFPKRNFFIVNPENISMKPWGWLIEMLGAITVPGDKEAMKNFLKAIEYHINKKHSITIYPEAHIWPYYTKIRPFKSVSFKYPIQFNKPAFCITNTYQSYGKNNDKIQIVSYIDGPFYADSNLSIKEQKEDLRNKIYNCMVHRSKNNNIEYIKYIKKVSEANDDIK